MATSATGSGTVSDEGLSVYEIYYGCMQAVCKQIK